MNQAQFKRWLIAMLLQITASNVVFAGGVQSAIDPAGPQSARLAQLWWFMFWTCSAVFVIVMVATFYAFARGRRAAAGSNEPLRPELHRLPEKERRLKSTIIGATAVTILILFGFLIDSFLVGRAMTSELDRKQGVTIEITGHQWWWEVRYNNVDASSIFTTANEIHIPVGVPVTFSLKGGDVIHSFWVPNLTGKKDLIPGKIATIWLQADRAGVYRGQCAEYCGHQHAHMGLWVIAEPLDQFNSWLSRQAQPAVAPADPELQRGQQVFLTSTCVMCHAIGGTPAGSNIGPNLTHVASRQTIAAATLSNDHDQLANWITDSQKIKPGNRMPPNYLQPNDLESLVNYLQSLK
jgi:cytochrome c oxidase subunit 2